MNVLIVPSLGLDVTLLERLALSVDHPIQHKLVILNGRTWALDYWQRAHPDWKVLIQADNLGVAGSWNLAAAICPHEKAWLICNEDIWFPPGILKQFCEFGDANADSHSILRLNDSSPYYCFIHTRNNIEDVGHFDENFWPAYYEDCDYNVRLRRARLQIHNCFTGQNQVNHGKPRTGGMDYNAFLQGVGLFNRRYWYQKWGSMDTESAAFKTPFNRVGAPLSQWTLDRKRRARMQPIFDEFMAVPNPSIYD
jgi:hypothetical protein